MKPEIVCVDTNVFIRLFTQDVPEHTKAAQAFFTKGREGQFTFVVNDLIMAEMAWVLRRAYRLSPEQIRKHLLATINTPFIELRPADLALQVTQALNIFVLHNIDYTDAYIAAWMQMHNMTTIYTFNRKHFTRVPGIEVRVP